MVSSQTQRKQEYVRTGDRGEGEGKVLGKSCYRRSSWKDRPGYIVQKLRLRNAIQNI